MRLKTILNELDKALELWEKGAKVQALEKLYRLRNRIAQKLERVVNVFKDLLERYGLSEEEIKETYTWWLNLKKEEVPKHLYKTYSIVLTDRQTRAITDFRGKLRHIKGLKNELQERSWTSSEYERGQDYYRRLIQERLKEASDD